MVINFKTTTRVGEAAEFIVSSISNQLKIGKQVLFFVTGGSSIAVGIKVSELLRENLQANLTKNLTIMMTDERYGVLGHQDSNWHQLMERGFRIPRAKLIPILNGNDRASTVEKFNKNLSQELMENKETKYKIGLFGIGADGHTAGILPKSEVVSDAVKSEDLAFGYDTLTFSRITVTPKAIEKLDEIVAWVQGEDKWSVLESLEKDIPVIEQPAQILKKVPSLTIFTDYKKTNG